MNIEKYNPTYKKKWDDFVHCSKNGMFMFCRDYMEYHADRFDDLSLMFFDDDILVGLMPANKSGDILVTHGGLTFGGIICDHQMKAYKMLAIFESFKNYLLSHGISKVIYKAVPHIYHRIPSEEDLYALFINKANLFRRDISSTVLLKDRLSISKGRKHSVNKSQKFAIEIERSFTFSEFMDIEIKHLEQRHGKLPVHTTEEIAYLASMFPDNIKLFAAFKDKIMLAGVLIYESSEVAHAQYIAATDLGKNVGALDAIMDYLVNSYYLDKKYFDFGISTEEQGKYLNINLINNKESFGARSVVYDFYEMNLQ